MLDIEISISPILSNTWFFSFEDSYKFGVSEGTIYTPRFFNRDISDNYENETEITRRITNNLVHEVLHKIIYEFEGENSSKLFDNLAKNTDNDKYLIGTE
jgi:hypothetical protein